MQSADLSSEIKLLVETLPYAEKSVFIRLVNEAGRLHKWKNYAAVILGLCNADEVPKEVLCRLGEVLALYRRPLVGISYFEVFKLEDLGLAFYSVAVKRDGEWIRVPRKLRPSDFISDMRLKEPVYILHSQSEAIEWFHGWGRVAMIKADIFNESFRIDDFFLEHKNRAEYE